MILLEFIIRRPKHRSNMSCAGFTSTCRRGSFKISRGDNKLKRYNLAGHPQRCVKIHLDGGKPSRLTIPPASRPSMVSLEQQVKWNSASRPLPRKSQNNKCTQVQLECLLPCSILANQEKHYVKEEAAPTHTGYKVETRRDLSNSLKGGNKFSFRQAFTSNRAGQPSGSYPNRVTYQPFAKGRQHYGSEHTSSCCPNPRKSHSQNSSDSTGNRCFLIKANHDNPALRATGGRVAALKYSWQNCSNDECRLWAPTTNRKQFFHMGSTQNATEINPSRSCHHQNDASFCPEQSQPFLNGPSSTAVLVRNTNDYFSNGCQVQFSQDVPVCEHRPLSNDIFGNDMQSHLRPIDQRKSEPDYCKTSYALRKKNTERMAPKNNNNHGGSDYLTVVQNTSGIFSQGYQNRHPNGLPAKMEQVTSVGKINSDVKSNLAVNAEYGMTDDTRRLAVSAATASVNKRADKSNSINGVNIPECQRRLTANHAVERHSPDRPTTKFSNELITDVKSCRTKDIDCESSDVNNQKKKFVEQHPQVTIHYDISAVMGSELPKSNAAPTRNSRTNKNTFFSSVKCGYNYLIQRNAAAGNTSSGHVRTTKAHTSDLSMLAAGRKQADEINGMPLLKSDDMFASQMVSSAELFKSSNPLGSLVPAKLFTPIDTNDMMSNVQSAAHVDHKTSISNSDPLPTTSQINSCNNRAAKSTNISNTHVHTDRLNIYNSSSIYDGAVNNPTKSKQYQRTSSKDANVMVDTNHQLLHPMKNHENIQSTPNNYEVFRVKAVTVNAISPVGIDHQNTVNISDECVPETSAQSTKALAKPPYKYDEKAEQEQIHSTNNGRPSLTCSLPDNKTKVELLEKDKTMHGRKCLPEMESNSVMFDQTELDKIRQRYLSRERRKTSVAYPVSCSSRSHPCHSVSYSKRHQAKPTLDGSNIDKLFGHSDKSTVTAGPGTATTQLRDENIHILVTILKNQKLKLEEKNHTLENNLQNAHRSLESLRTQMRLSEDEWSLQRSEFRNSLKVLEKELEQVIKEKAQAQMMWAQVCDEKKKLETNSEERYMEYESEINDLRSKCEDLEIGFADLGNTLRIERLKRQEDSNEWLTFQRDLQTAVRVANDLKYEAEERAKHLEGELNRLKHLEDSLSEEQKMFNHPLCSAGRSCYPRLSEDARYTTTSKADNSWSDNYEQNNCIDFESSSRVPIKDIIRKLEKASISNQQPSSTVHSSSKAGSMVGTTGYSSMSTRLATADSTTIRVKLLWDQMFADKKATSQLKSGSFDRRVQKRHFSCQTMSNTAPTGNIIPSCSVDAEQMFERNGSHPSRWVNDQIEDTRNSRQFSNINKSSNFSENLQQSLQSIQAQSCFVDNDNSSNYSRCNSPILAIPPHNLDSRKGLINTQTHQLEQQDTNTTRITVAECPSSPHQLHGTTTDDVKFITCRSQSRLSRQQSFPFLRSSGNSLTTACMDALSNTHPNGIVSTVSGTSASSFSNQIADISPSHFLSDFDVSDEKVHHLTSHHSNCTEQYKAVHEPLMIQEMNENSNVLSFQPPGKNNSEFDDSSSTDCFQAINPHSAFEPYQCSKDDVCCPTAVVAAVKQTNDLDMLYASLKPNYQSVSINDSLTTSSHSIELHVPRYIEEPDSSEKTIRSQHVNRLLSDDHNDILSTLAISFPHKSSKRNALLEWCREQTKDYQVDITNFSSCWTNGDAAISLLHSILPKEIPSELLLVGSAELKVRVALDVSERMGIKTNLSQDDLLVSERPSWEPIMDYVTEIYRYYLIHKHDYKNAVIEPNQIDNRQSSDNDNVSSSNDFVIMQHIPTQANSYETDEAGT